MLVQVQVYRHTFSSAEHIIFISDSVSVVPRCLATSMTAGFALKPTREMRFSAKGKVQRSEVREGKLPKFYQCFLDC